MGFEGDWDWHIKMFGLQTWPVTCVPILLWFFIVKWPKLKSESIQEKLVSRFSWTRSYYRQGDTARVKPQWAKKLSNKKGVEDAICCLPSLFYLSQLNPIQLTPRLANILCSSETVLRKLLHSQTVVPSAKLSEFGNSALWKELSWRNQEVNKYWSCNYYKQI